MISNPAFRRRRRLQRRKRSGRPTWCSLEHVCVKSAHGPRSHMCAPCPSSGQQPCLLVYPLCLTLCLCAKLGYTYILSSVCVCVYVCMFVLLSVLLCTLSVCLHLSVSVFVFCFFAWREAWVLIRTHAHMGWRSMRGCVAQGRIGNRTVAEASVTDGRRFCCSVA